MKTLFFLFIFISVSIISYAQCTHTVRLWDEFSDGWNGGTISVRVNGVTVLNNITLNAGAGPLDFDFSASTGQTITIIRTAAGSYPEEMRVEVLNPNCQTLYGLVEPVASPGASFNASCPAAGAQYTTLGDASTSGNCVILTSAVNDERGCSWDLNSTLNFAANFSYDLTVNLGSSDAGADGLSFVIQNDARGTCACGGNGSGMGASGITNSLIVEIDTYLNSEDRDDGLPGVLCAGGPDPDHMDIWLNGNVNPNNDGNNCTLTASERTIPTAQRLLTSGGANYNVENGLNHTLRISWNAATSTFTAQLKDATPGAHSYATVSYSFNPMTVFGTTTPNFGFTASTGGLNNQQSYCLPGVLLPIELLYFDAKLNEKQTVNLTWETASERNNDYFTIEKSMTGSDWEYLGNVDGAGTTSTPHSYYLEDLNPAFGNNYYRLKQTDFNGNYVYSDIKNVNLPFSDNIQIYPNPSNNKISFNGYDLSSCKGITIYSLTGKIEKKLAFSQTISIEDLATGTYLVQLDFDGKKVIRKINKL
ncbi:MAG: lectin-like domain-containing protein [Flavobacteriia bacterium]|jgi:hypothetical protein